MSGSRGVSDTPSSVDLSNCDREPIHVPGSIQPHGVLIALRAPDLFVAQVSENIQAYLGVSPDEALGRPLAAFLSPESAELIRGALEHERWDELNPLRIEAGGKRFDGIIHRYAGAAIVEIEPAQEAFAQGSIHHPLRSAMIHVEAARTLPDLCQSAVAEVRRLTGFERVMLYRFDEEGHGSVDAEARVLSLEPYLGLHYPASDIPQQARQLYLRNWLRIIPDARYRPARLVPNLRPDTGAPLDLSFAVLRSVSPTHLEYLANMGVRASMSVSLIVRDRLWGLISCAHHSGPRQLPYELRSACEVLGRLVSLQIAALSDREAATQRSSRQGTLELLACTMRGRDDALEALFVREAELLTLVGAQGAAAVGAGEVLTCGLTPPSAQVAALADWLDEHAGLAPFATASLPALLPEAAETKDVASGVLTFALPGARPRRLLWFRPELVQTVNWGGDPTKAVLSDGALRVHPRRSFELWKEEVRLRSLPWTESDVEAARELRRLAVESDLERKLLREQQAVRLRDDLVAVVSHDLRSPLNVIQMQAALLLRAPLDEPAAGRVRTGAERIQRSVARMNVLIRDLLDLAKIEAGRFALEWQTEEVGAMVDEGLVLLRPLADAKGITIREELTEVPPVRADRERVFQVLSNLVGNAIKFTPERGTIVVRAEPQGRAVQFTVADTGPGIAPEQLAHLFDRYWQATRRQREGAGLGLYIAKGIIEAHGGKIWADAQTGSGARFMFTLPVA